MSYLKGKDPSSAETVRLNMRHIALLSVSGSGSAYSIFASMVGTPGTQIVVKDGFTSKAQADSALDDFLADIGIEVIN